MTLPQAYYPPFFRTPEPQISLAVVALTTVVALRLKPSGEIPSAVEIERAGLVERGHHRREYRSETSVHPKLPSCDEQGRASCAALLTVFQIPAGRGD